MQGCCNHTCDVWDRCPVHQAKYRPEVELAQMPGSVDPIDTTRPYPRGLRDAFPALYPYMSADQAAMRRPGPFTRFFNWLLS